MNFETVKDFFMSENMINYSIAVILCILGAFFVKKAPLVAVLFAVLGVFVFLATSFNIIPDFYSIIERF